MSLSKVYINNTSSFLPNEAVSNEEMEMYLGMINGNPSKSRGIVLRNNGIKQRYYALTKEGKPTHTNAEMTALAVRGLFKDDTTRRGRYGAVQNALVVYNSNLDGRSLIRLLRLFSRLTAGMPQMDSF